MSESKDLEILELKKMNLILQAHGLERDIIVREYARLMNEVSEISKSIDEMKKKIGVEECGETGS